MLDDGRLVGALESQRETTPRPRDPARKLATPCPHRAVFYSPVSRFGEKGSYGDVPLMDEGHARAYPIPCTLNPIPYTPTLMYEP